MTVRGAAILQERHPGAVMDYLSITNDAVAEENIEDIGCAIVTFPRNPKPHEVVEKKDWVKRHWKDLPTYI